MLQRQETLAGGLGVGIALGIAALDVLSRGRSEVFAGLVAIGPFVTAVLAGPRVTAGVAGAAVLLAGVLGVANGLFGSFGHGLEIGVVAVAGALAVGLTSQRQQAQRSLTSMRRIAEAVQQALIPPVPETLGPVRLAARYESSVADALVGGDFYEAVDTPYGVRAIIGDVCGKGLPAVRLAAKATSAFLTAAPLEADLVRVVKAMETSLDTHLGEEKFITAALVEFTADGSLTVVNCGHHPPVYLADGQVQLLSCPSESLPLGFHDEPVTGRFALAPAFRLLLYTDGLVEARDDGGQMLPLLTTCRTELSAPTVAEAADGLLESLHPLQERRRPRRRSLDARRGTRDSDRLSHASCSAATTGRMQGTEHWCA